MEEGFLYLVDPHGDIIRTKDNKKFEKVVKCLFPLRPGGYYYVDEDGDISIAESDKAKEIQQAQIELLAKSEQVKFEAEEREKIRKKQLRRGIRRKLLKEEFAHIKDNLREPIPEEVKHEVWRRDAGKCAKCGSQENLEYDHIIPISQGGASTARNLQILCEKCNREKSDHI